MEFVCRHCDKLCDGNAYRVLSEDDGIILLDVIVCYFCAMEARRLGLTTHKIDLPAGLHPEVVLH